MRSKLSHSFLLLLVVSIPSQAFSLDECRPLPRNIKVFEDHPRCDNPTILLQGRWRTAFSAVFRWDDGSDEGQDRSPFDLENSDASSSPYKVQDRISRGRRKTILCFGDFLNRKGFPVPEQMTIKRTASSSVKRYCVSFNENQ